MTLTATEVLLDDSTVERRLSTEAHIAAAAWAVAETGCLADLSESELRLVGGIERPDPAVEIDGLVDSVRRGEDPLGEAFVRVRHPERRRLLGAVYTPPEIVSSMVAWTAGRGRPSRVVDPGTGSARFLLAAGRAFPVASLVGVEIDPLAALVARANLTAAGFDGRSRIVVDDYLEADLGTCTGTTCRVHRGAVTGANKTWITDAGDPSLPGGVLFPAITRARELFGAGNTLLGGVQDLRAVIDLPADLDAFDADDRARIDRFLRLATHRGVPVGYIARNRNPWWSVRLREPAPILATYMARRPPAFVRNRAAVRHVNVAHGIYPREPMTGPAIDALAAALRAAAPTAIGRTYAGGLIKFEPSEMARILVPELAMLEATAA